MESTTVHIRVYLSMKPKPVSLDLVYLEVNDAIPVNTHRPLTRYVKLCVAHEPGMPGTFSPAADFIGNR